MLQIHMISDEEEEEENLDDQDERGNLKDFINDEEEGEEDEGSDSVDSEDDVGNRSRKRSESLCALRLGGNEIGSGEEPGLISGTLCSL